MVVNVEDNFERELGVKFGVTAPPHISGNLSGANQVVSGTAPSAVLPIEDRLNFMNVPAATIGSAQSPASIGVALVKLGKGVLLDLELSALESEGGAEIISSPRLITADQTPAHIEVGEEIPYPVATSSGATAIEFRKAVLGLDVTPRITPDHRVILTLKVNQDKRGKDTIGGPSIDTREVQTNVLVNNGQTVVLGGLYERDKRKVVTRVPFLGSIPILGALFRHNSTKDLRKELLIFVTPKIITQSMGNLQGKNSAVISLKRDHDGKIRGITK